MFIKLIRVIEVKRGLQAAEWRGGKGVQSQALMPGMDVLNFEITKTLYIPVQVCDYFQLFRFSARLEVCQQNLAILLAAVGKNRGQNRGALAPKIRWSSSLRRW